MFNPKILIASPVRNAAKWLDRYLSSLAKLKYPKNRLHYAFLEGNSIDSTYEKLLRFKRSHTNVWLKKFNLKPQRTRIMRLAILRNMIIDEALMDEDYVFMVDCDVVDLPSNILNVFVRRKKDIIAPLVIINGTNNFYDTHAFIYKKRNFSHIKPYAPPLIVKDPLPFQVESVGTCYLVKRRVYDAKVRYDQDTSEQRTFCLAARKRNFKVWVDPKVIVKHANLERYGEGWH